MAKPFIENKTHMNWGINLLYSWTCDSFIDGK